MKLPIEGKVLRIDKTQDGWYYEVAIASQDPYARPNVFRIKSLPNLCNEGDVRLFDATVTSWVSRERYTDKKTGEIKEIARPVVLLQADTALMPKVAPPKAVSN